MWRGPRVRCLLHGDESEEKVQRRMRRGPRALCFRGGDGEAAARGPDSMVSLCQMVFAGAAALQRQVLHSGGLLGVVRSVFLDFLST